VSILDLIIANKQGSRTTGQGFCSKRSILMVIEVAKARMSDYGETRLGSYTGPGGFDRPREDNRRMIVMKRSNHRQAPTFSRLSRDQGILGHWKKERRKKQRGEAKTYAKSRGGSQLNLKSRWWHVERRGQPPRSACSLQKAALTRREKSYCVFGRSRHAATLHKGSS